MIHPVVSRPLISPALKRFTRFGGWVTLFMLLVATAGSTVLRPHTAEAQPSNYNDPGGYPIAWPSTASWKEYTRNGVAVSDLRGGNGDASKGANPTQSSDFSDGDTGQTTFFFYGTGSVMFFRFRVAGPPLALTGNGEPWSSETWNVLFDIDGDGWKEFVMMLDGEDSNSEPDDIVIIYQNGNTQKFNISGDALWRQDSAIGDTTLSDGESGGSGAWDLDTNAYKWDWGRSRVVQIDTTKAAGSNLSEYYVDVQVPVAAFNASGSGGPTMTSSTPFTLSMTTSNSNTDPTQKDLLFSGTFSLGDVTLPTGDIADPNGNINQDPFVFNMTHVQTCPSDSINVFVLDALKVVSGSAATTIDSVVIQYYYDFDGDSLADDNSTWLEAGKAALVSGTLNHWRLVSNATTRAGTFGSQKYLFRAIIYDSQGNVTNSFDSGKFISAANPCGSLPGFNASTKTIQDAPDSIAPNSTPTYVLTIRQTKSGVKAYNVVVTDTLSEYTPWLSLTTNGGFVVSVDSSSTWPSSAKKYILSATKDSLAFTLGTVIKFQVTLISPLGDNIIVENKYYVTASNTAGPYCATQSFTVDSEPTITLAKFVNGVNDTSGVPGDSMIFTIVYSNVGTDSATNVTVTDANPVGTTYIPNSVIHKGVGDKTDLSDADDVTVNTVGPTSTISVTIGTLEAAVTDTIKFKTIITDQ